MLASPRLVHHHRHHDDGVTWCGGHGHDLGEFSSGFGPILVNEERTLKKGAAWVLGGGRYSGWKVGPWREEFFWNESLFEISPALAPVDIGKSEHPVAVDGKPVWRLPPCYKDRSTRGGLHLGFGFRGLKCF